MAKGGKGAGENTKKAAGNAKKAEVAAGKAAKAAQQAEAQESASWSEGAKSNKKQQDAEAKKAEAERKKAEKAALLAEEEANQPSKPKNTKSAQKKNEKPAPSRKLDLGQLEDDGGPSNAAASSINASGIDNALDALALTGSSNNDKIEKHPERRFKAAYAAFEERRLPEIEEENPGLRKNQRVALARKEFEKHPDNPFNQVSVRYDATKEDIKEMKAAERKKVEERLAG